MDTTQKMFKQTTNLVLKPIMERASKKFPTSGQVNHDLLQREYQRFLVLAFSSLHSSNKFPCRPPPLIDIIWHEHILFTRQYEADCQMVGGQFLHHTPEPTPTTTEKITEYANDATFLLKQYRLSFGEDAPTAIWPIPVLPQTVGYDSWCGPTCG